MPLLPADTAILDDRGLAYQVTDDAGMTCVVISGWSLPDGYDRDESDLLIRLPAGFPDVAPDMWWFDPPVRQSDGSAPPATEAVEVHLQRSWQRWSRHFDAGQWQSGIDGLQSYLALITHELVRCALGSAA